MRGDEKNITKSYFGTIVKKPKSTPKIKKLSEETTADVSDFDALSPDD